MVDMETGLPLFCIPVMMEGEGKITGFILPPLLFTQDSKLKLDFSKSLNQQSQIESEQEAMFYEKD